VSAKTSSLMIFYKYPINAYLIWLDQLHMKELGDEKGRQWGEEGNEPLNIFNKFTPMARFTQ